MLDFGLLSVSFLVRSTMPHRLAALVLETDNSTELSIYTETAAGGGRAFLLAGATGFFKTVLALAATGAARRGGNGGGACRI